MFTREPSTILEFNGTTIRMCRSVFRKTQRDITHCFSFGVEDFNRDAVGLIKMQMKRQRLKFENVVLVLPRYQAMSRFITLPSTDSGEIKDMVALHVQREAAFTKGKEAIYDYQLAWVDACGNSVVVVFLLANDCLDNYLNILKKCGIIPTHVTLNTQGLADWFLLNIKNELVESGKGYFLLNSDHGMFDFYVMYKNICVFSRTFSVKEEGGTGVESLSREVRISYGLFRRIGLKHVEYDEALYLAGPLAWASKQLEESLGLPVKEFYSLGQLRIKTSVVRSLSASDISYACVLGLSLRKRSLGSFINITPPQVYLSVKLNKQWLLWRKRMAFVALSACILFLVSGFVFNKKVKVLLSASESLKQNANSEFLMGGFSRAAIFKDSTGQGVRLFDILNYIYSVTLEKINLLSLSFSNTNIVLLKGRSADSKTVFDYLKALKQADYFKKCSLGALNIKTTEVETQVRFDITCSI